MAYYIDFNKITIEDYKEKLKSAYLSPSRRILWENIDEYFEKIKRQKISNLEELFQALKTKNKLLKFSEESNISIEYLTILIREIKSNKSKPNKISDFPEINVETIIKLEQFGIKNTFQLYDYIKTEKDREKFSNKIKINKNEILKLAKLTDLSRIRWVNHTFAFMLIKTGYETAEIVANSDFKKLYQDINNLNDKLKFYKGKIGLNDMKICIEAAKDVPKDIIF